jgi:hypothetical protein
MTFKTATISSAISAISFNDVNKTVSISFNSRPDNVYEYVVSDYEMIKDEILEIIDANASGNDTRSLGSYVSRLLKSDSLELVSA